MPGEVFPCSPCLCAATSSRPAGTGARLDRAAAGLRLVIGAEKGNITKQRDLGKETGYIYWVLLSGESQTWAELD